VYAVAVTDNAWFVAIGHTYGAVPDGETVQCMIVKCTNFVTPSWSIVHTNLYGCPADIGMIGSGARVAYGVYKNFDLNLGAGGQNIYKCGVYVSDDEGATWETAAEIPATILSGSDYHVLWHAHGIAFDPNDEDKLYVTMGDYASAGGPPYFHSLSRTTPGVWTDTALFRSQLANLIYFNGEWYGGQHTLNLFDVTTGRKSEVFSPAGVSDAPTTYPYSERQDVSTIQSFASYGGVLYAGYQKFVMLPGYEALLVSVNGRDWSCIARNPGTYGYQHVLGYAGGKMWAESVDGAGNAALYSFDPVAAAEVEALRIERPRTNLLTTRQDTTFVLTNGTGNLGSWVVSGNHNPTSGPDVLATSSADADKCLHFTSATNDEWTAINSGALVGAFGSTLSNGDYFAVSARCWSPNSNYRFAIGLYPHPATNITCDRDTHRVLLSATPKRIWLLGKCTGAIDNSLYLKVYVFGYSGTEIIDVYMDQFAWYKSATEWPLWDEWQRGDVPRTAETVCLPLGGLPAGGYTICWDWLGGMSELMTADHPILTLEADDGSYLEVSWIASTSKVQLSNGDATATMATALTRLREDVIRFVLVYDSAVGHTLTIVDPVNGQQSCTANFHDAFSTTNPPRHCLIGESLDGIAEQGHGLFWNLVRYDHALTAGEITTHLASAGVGLVAGDGLPAAANVLEDIDRGDGTAGTYVAPVQAGYSALAAGYGAGGATSGTLAASKIRDATYGTLADASVLVAAGGTFDEAARNADPGEANVWTGTSYKIANTSKNGSKVASSIANCSAGNVKKDVAVGDVTGAYDPMAAAVFPSESNVTTVETAYGPTGAEYAGNYVSPSESSVAAGVTYGPSDSLTGTAALTLQNVADALKLAPTAGDPADGSAMDRLDANSTVLLQVSLDASDAKAAAEAVQTDYQQRGQEVTLPSAPAGYGGSTDAGDFTGTFSAEVLENVPAMNTTAIATAVWAASSRTLAGSALGVGPTAARSQADTVFKGGTVGLYARVLGWDGEDLQQSDVTSIVYSIYVLDVDDEDVRTAVSGHATSTLTVGDVLWDTVQSDEWASNWNFKFIPNISTSAAFADVGTTYLVEVTFTPTTGQKIVVRFKVRTV
jgi:hypothetical protein